MGAGAGSFPGRNDKASAGFGSDAEATGPLAAAEGGICWLLSAIEKEKAEKEWLASRFEWLTRMYEEKCAEVRSLREEIAAQRHDLQLARDLAQPLQAKRTAVEQTMRQISPPVVAKAPGDVMASWDTNSRSAASLPPQAVFSQAPPSALAASDSSSALQVLPREHGSLSGEAALVPISPTGKNNLKDRRGLRLGGLSVESRRKGVEGEAIEPVDESTFTSPSASPPSAPAVNLLPSCGPTAHELQQGAQKKGVWQEFIEEPLSALLRRRKEEWMANGPPPAKAATAAAPAPTLAPAAAAGGAAVAGLRVAPLSQATKVMRLEKDDPDCPASPKRAGRKGAVFG